MSLLLCAANECGKRPMMRGGALKAGNDRVFKQELTYTKSSQSILNKHGDLVITGIDIKRTPIQASFAVKSLGLLKDKPFDILYHLFMLVTLSDGKTIRVEKNEVISIAVHTGKDDKNTESIKIIKVPKNKTPNQMLQLTNTKMGANMFRYSALESNCQDFLLNIMTSNKFGRKEVKTFVKQDVSNLVSAGLEKGLQFITRIAGIAKTVKD
jgi:hypothetical protein